MKENHKLICDYLWAKSNPFKPLWMHLLETGIIAQKLVSYGCFYPLGKELCHYLQVSELKMLALVGYIASVHDIGKAAGPFQGHDDRMKEILKKEQVFCDGDGFRHEDYGAYRLGKLWSEKKRVSDFRFRKYLEAVIRYHHQKIISKVTFRKKIEYSKVDNPLLKEIREELENKLWVYFNPPDVKPKHTDAVCTLLLGIIITADWIASGDVFALLDVHRNWEQVVKDTHYLIKRFLQDNHMEHCEFPERIQEFTDLWESIPREGMRPLQVKVEKIMDSPKEVPLAVILEAPMGEGKTEAGLFMASRLAQFWGKEGFYVALPTAATSNQMHGRVDRMLRCMNIAESKLMHGMAWVIEDDDGTTEQEFHGESSQDALLWTAPMRRGLISSFAVGTIDQAMLAAMRTKYGVLRLAGLTQKVLIIDELHAYDAYMSSIIKKLLQWCHVLHIPVVMLSATLPLEKKRDFAECYHVEACEWSSNSYPTITLLYENKSPQEVPVSGTHQKLMIDIESKPFLEQPDKIASLVKERIDSSGGCFAVILNTVRAAQETYRAIKGIVKEDCQVILFHARFSVKRRNELEQECIRLLGREKIYRPRSLVVVATQVVEQSLDLDFDGLISDICPIDLLLQRAGRLWRHEDTQRPVNIDAPRLTVLLPEKNDFKSSGMVYPSVLLERTRKIVLDKKFFQIPEEIPGLVEKVYAGYVMDENELEQWIEYQTMNQVSEGEAEQQELPLPGKSRFWLENGAGKQQGIFYSDEDTAFLAAKTRLGEASLRLAILPEHLFGDVKERDSISRSLAKQVFQYSVAVAERKVTFLKESTFWQGEKPLEGKGLLSGLWMLPGIRGTCRFDDGHLVCLEDEFGLLVDDEIAHMIEGDVS